MKNYLFLLLGILFSIQTHGQENTGLFNNSNRTEVNFDQKQTSKLNRMVKNPIYLGHYFVKVNDLKDINRNGGIRVNLPDKKGSILFKNKEIKFTTEDEFVYYGETDQTFRGEMGYIHLIAKNGNVFGQINIGDEIYELQDFGKRKNVLFKIDPSIYTEAECGNKHNHTHGPVKNIDRDVNRNIQPINDQERIGCTVDVLVLYTANADAIGNPVNSANTFIQQTNQAAANSDANVTFSLVDVKLLPGFTEDQFIDVALKDLQTDPSANNLRNFYNADLVILLTDGNWVSLSSGSTFGIAFLDEWGDADFGYAIAELDAAGGRFTFTHEVAHDFGCKHNDDDRGQPDFTYSARGHSFKQGGWWPFRKTRRTILNYSDGGSRILHFSNPDVEFGGKDTGVSNSRENADQLSSMACTIADYRYAPPPMNVNITGPTSGINGQNYTWCANVSSCNNVSSYSWSYSLDGSTYYSLSTSSSCLTSNLPNNSNVYYRVTVTCADGQTDTDWHHVDNGDTPPCSPCLKESVETEAGFDNTSKKKTQLEEFSTVNKVDVVDLFPNPANQSITLEFDLTSDSFVQIEVFDLTGKKVQSLINKSVNQGHYSKTFDISSLIDGYYFIKGNIGNQIITESVIKQGL